MKQKRLAPILAVTLSLEMMLSPLAAYAEDNSTAKKINNTASAVSSGIQAVGAIWNQLNNGPQGNMLPPQTTADIQKLKEQQTPQVDKYFNAQKLMQIPGLANYLALNRINPAMLDCKTLPTTMFDAQPEACRVGMMMDTGIPQNVQMAQMNAYYNEYFQISKMYSNFSADSNSDGQAFGVGCMNNAMNILNGFFKYRLDELDKLTTNLEAMQNKFREQSRSDLDAIEEAVAVLDGDSEIANKVRSKKPDLFDFGKRFNNPACNSMFAGEKLNDMGRSNGLNSINRNIKDLMTTKNGKYSGESYSQSHASVVEDINSSVDKIAKQIELNFNTQGQDQKAYNEFLKNVPGSISSSSGIQDAIRLDSFSDLQSKYAEQYAKISEEKALITSEIPASATALSKLGTLNAATFEAEVNSLENGIKNQCLANSIGDQKSLLSKIYDPSASSHANKYASNFLKDKLSQIMNNQSTSIEKKLADLKALEAQEGNRYYVRMQNSYEVQDVDANGNLTTKVVDANVRRSPSVYMSDLVNNCNAQFKANKLGNKLTGASAIQRLRNLSTNFKNLAKSQASDAKKELRKKLIECTSPEVANNTVAGSCEPSLFNPRTPGFCANAAFSCSKNMQACSKQAEGYVKEIRDQKTARVNNYKALLEKNKLDIVKIFDTALAGYMKDGEMLRGMFGAGFSSPAGIKREVPENQRYLSSFAEATGKQGSPDGKLLLEDPDKYMEMFKENIALLKASVQKQQDQILGGDSVSSDKAGLLANHIKKTKENYKIVANEAKVTSTQCRSAYDNVVQEGDRARKEQMKKMTELGEKRQEFCDAYGTLSKSERPNCDELGKTFFKDSYKAAIVISQDPYSIAAAKGDVARLEEYCNRYGKADETSKTGVNALEICATRPPKDDKDADQKLETLCTQYDSYRDPTNKDCIGEVITRNGTDTVKTEDILPKCTKMETKLGQDIELYFKLSKRAAKGPALSLEGGAPAYCAAGDNSNRSSGKNDMATFFDQLARSLGSKAQ